MAKVHNRDHIAVFRGRFTLLPLLPLSRNRSNSSFSCIGFLPTLSSEIQGSLDTETIAPISYTFYPGVDSFPQS